MGGWVGGRKTYRVSDTAFLLQLVSHGDKGRREFEAVYLLVGTGKGKGASSYRTAWWVDGLIEEEQAV